MTGVYSGGLAYEYTLEANGYGLVEVGSNGQVKPNRDFDRLMQAYNETPNPSGSGGARRNRSVPQCPPRTMQWEVDTERLPVMPAGAQKYMKNGAGKGPGLGGDESSQWAGTPSETDPDLSDGVLVGDNEAGTGDSPSGGGSASGEEGAACSVTVKQPTLCAMVVAAIVFMAM